MNQNENDRPGAPIGKVVDAATALEEALRLAAPEPACKSDTAELRFDSLLPGEILAICGEPGIGKTSFALKAAAEAARRSRSVLFCSLESSAADIGRRLISIEAGIPFESLSCGAASTKERELLTRAMEGITELDLRILDDYSLDCSRLEAAVNEHANPGMKPIVIIDRADSLDGFDPWDSDGAILASLKRLAGKLGIPIIATLGFDIDDFSHRIKTACSAADIAATLRRPIKTRVPSQNESIVSLEIVKNRRAPTFKCEFAFDRKSQRFIEYQHLRDATELLSSDE